MGVWDVLRAQVIGNLAECRLAITINLIVLLYGVSGWNWQVASGDGEILVLESLPLADANRKIVGHQKNQRSGSNPG